jgi:hypothetical protein
MKSVATRTSTMASAVWMAILTLVNAWLKWLRSQGRDRIREWVGVWPVRSPDGTSPSYSSIGSVSWQGRCGKHPVSCAGASRPPKTNISNPPNGPSLGPHQKRQTPNIFPIIESASRGTGALQSREMQEQKRCNRLRPGARRERVLEPEVN